MKVRLRLVNCPSAKAKSGPGEVNVPHRVRLPRRDRISPLQKGNFLTLARTFMNSPG
jgi:hypothetical protein